jgi:hypothetical protein
MNTKRVGRLGLSETEENALVSFMQTLTDGFMSPMRWDGQADRTLPIFEREPGKADQDGARTIKPFVAPDCI